MDREKDPSLQQLVVENTDPLSRKPYEWPDGRGRALLPVDYYIPEVIRQLDEGNQVVVVSAQTGTGKSTHLPQALALEERFGKITATLPFRGAVSQIGTRVAEEMGSRIGGVVGWKLHGEPDRTSSETKITFGIDQSLLNQILRDRKLPEGVIIVDEAHLRTIQIDMLLAVIKEYLPSSPGTKVVITSATFNEAQFAEFFNAAEPIRAINDRLYPVEVKPLYLEKYEHHTEGAIRAARTVLDQFAKGKLTIPDANPGGTNRQTVDKGSVLVLLPGKEDIRQAIRDIKAYAKEKGFEEKVEVMECHGQMSVNEQALINTPVLRSKIRFIVATEVIRSSVTPPEAVGVIDSMQVKRNFVDENGVSHLGKITVAGAEADQGKGRVGRVQPGFYIPVSFDNEYERITKRGGPEYWPLPEIKREALSSVVLRVASAELDIKTLPMLDKPDSLKIAVAVRRLQQIGALDEHEKITALGKELVKFPLDPERALVLFEAKKRGVINEAVIAMAVLENNGIRFIPQLNEKFAIVNEEIVRKILTTETALESLPIGIEKLPNGKFQLDFSLFRSNHDPRSVAAIVWREFAQGTNSDFYAAVQAYRGYRANRSNKNWCKENFLNKKSLERVEGTVRDLWGEIQDSGIMSREESNTREAEEINAELTKSLLVGLIDAISIASGDGFSGPKAEFMYRANSSACVTNPSIAITESVRKDPNATDRRGRAIGRYFTDMLAPVELSWIEEVLPHLCEKKRVENSAEYDDSADGIFETEQVRLGKMVLHERQVPASSDKTALVLANVLADYSIFSKLQFVVENRKVIERLEDFYRRSQGTTQGPVSGKQLVEFYQPRLGNIRSQKQLDEALQAGLLLTLTLEDYIPKDLQELILEQSPDAIMIGDTQYPITYKDKGNWLRRENRFLASVIIPSDKIFGIEELPRLPSGQQITVSITGRDVFVIAGTDLALLQQKVKDSLLNKQFERFWTDNRDKQQAIPLPDYSLTGQQPDLPERIHFGQDPQTGDDVFTYPALIYKKGSYYEKPSFQIVHYATREGAQDAQADVIQMREEALQEQLAKEEQQQGEEEERKVHEEKMKKREIELVEQQERGEVLLHFKGLTNDFTTGKMQRFYVVGPDGVLREVDRKTKDENGRYDEWDIIDIKGGEILLEWGKGKNISSPHEFELSKWPEAEITEKQKKAIEKLQRNIGDMWETHESPGGGKSPPIGVGWIGMLEGKPPRAEVQEVESPEELGNVDSTTPFGSTEELLQAVHALKTKNTNGNGAAQPVQRPESKPKQSPKEGQSPLERFSRVETRAIVDELKALQKLQGKNARPRTQALGIGVLAKRFIEGEEGAIYALAEVGLLDNADFKLIYGQFDTAIKEAEKRDEEKTMLGKLRQAVEKTHAVIRASYNRDVADIIENNKEERKRFMRILAGHIKQWPISEKDVLELIAETLDEMTR